MHASVLNSGVTTVLFSLKAGVPTFYPLRRYRRGLKTRAAEQNGGKAQFGARVVARLRLHFIRDESESCEQTESKKAGTVDSFRMEELLIITFFLVLSAYCYCYSSGIWRK